MAVLLLIAGGVLMVGLAAIFWRLTGPGKWLRFGAVKLYYTPTVTVDEAKRVGEYLVRQKYGTDARLDRDGVTYRLELVCPSGPASEEEDVACEVLAAGLSDDVLAGATVEVRICDDLLRPISTVRHQGRFGRRITMNTAYLFYLEGVTDDEALLVATFLAGVGLFNDSPKIAQMNRSVEGYEFRLAVVVDPLTPELLNGARQMATDLSRVLGGVPVAVHYCRGLLGALRAGPARVAKEDAPQSCGPGGPYRTQVFHIPGEPSGDRLKHLKEKRDA